MSAASPYIFIDPDGCADPGLLVVVHAPTGVRYANPCGGLGGEERAVEGFLVPVSSCQHADGERVPQRDYQQQVLCSLFRPFGGAPPRDPAWPDGFLDEVERAVADIGMWRTAPDPERSVLRPLALDRARLAELTEAWLPVTTPYGPGTLLFRNCGWR